MARNIRISILGLSTARNSKNFDLARNLEEASAMLSIAADEKADLAVLPEIFAIQNRPDFFNAAEPLDGSVLSTISRIAKQHSMGIAAGHVTLEGDVKYNSVVLFDRQGEIAAVYHKTYLTIAELERGLFPGAGPLVVETEFGRLGFAICYDLNFSSLRLGYRELDPDMILFASAFRGGLQAQWWAYETRSYFVSSCIDPKSIIANPLGRIIAETDTLSRSATRTINLDYEVLHLDYCNKRLVEARRKYGSDFQFDWADPEGVMLITSTADVPVKQLMMEYGWKTAANYLADANRKRDAVLAGEKIPMGELPW
jgi:predicted amidohydrolase